MPLPTQGEIFSNALNELSIARRHIGDARDELKSDWRPGSPDLPPAAVKARDYVQKRVDKLEAEIDGMKSKLYEALEALRDQLTALSPAQIRKDHSMPRIFRVVGVDKDGLPVANPSPNERSARRSVEDMNRASAKRGQPEDWRAEFADLEWKPLTEEAK